MDLHGTSNFVENKSSLEKYQLPSATLCWAFTNPIYEDDPEIEGPEEDNTPYEDFEHVTVCSEVVQEEQIEGSSTSREGNNILSASTSGNDTTSLSSINTLNTSSLLGSTEANLGLCQPSTSQTGDNETKESDMNNVSTHNEDFDMETKAKETEMAQYQGNILKGRRMTKVSSCPQLNDMIYYHEFDCTLEQLLQIGQYSLDVYNSTG